jgi:hypothetical protein
VGLQLDLQLHQFPKVNPSNPPQPLLYPLLCSVGGAQFCLDTAREYTQQRRAFGSTLAQFQATQFRIADMATALQVGAGVPGRKTRSPELRAGQ